MPYMILEIKVYDADFSETLSSVKVGISSLQKPLFTSEDLNNAIKQVKFEMQKFNKGKQNAE